MRKVGQRAELFMSSDIFQNESCDLLCVCLSHITRAYDVIVGGEVLLSAVLSTCLVLDSTLPEVVISASGFTASHQACVCWVGQLKLREGWGGRNRKVVKT